MSEPHIVEDEYEGAIRCAQELGKQLDFIKQRLSEDPVVRNHPERHKWNDNIDSLMAGGGLMNFMKQMLFIRDSVKRAKR